MKSPVNQRKLLTGLLALMMYSITAIPASALDVSGTLNGGEWTASDGVINVTDNIILSAEDTLRIGPGVRVEFTGPYEFVINGLLEAVGNDSQRVVFTTAHSPVVDSLRWKGLRFENAVRGCKLVFCRIEHGWARGEWPQNNGGGLYIKSSVLDVRRCEFIRNKASGDGGAVYAWFSQSNFMNSLFVQDSCEQYGGAVFISNASPSITNCTFAFNHAEGWGGGLFLGANANPTIINTIANFNTQDLLDNNLVPGDNYFPNLARAQSAHPVVSYSNIREEGEPFAGAGNKAENPMFRSVDPAALDLHLKEYSPCIDAGDPGMNPGQETDNFINMGAYGGTLEATPSVPWFYNMQIANNSRINFGQTKINTQKSVEINIDNRGHYRLFIYDMQFSSPAFSTDSTEVDTFRVPSFRLSPVEPGERLKVALNFKPDTLRTFADTVVFITSDVIQPPPKLALSGECINPHSVIQNSLDFGTKKIGEVSTSRIYLKNIGESVLSITRDPTVQGNEFSVDAPNRSIQPRDSARINISFYPLLPDIYDGTATIPTNDSSLVLRLHGVGKGPRMEVLMDTLYLFLGYVYFDGDTSTYYVPIENQGDSVLVVDQARIDHVESFSALLPLGGLTIAPRSIDSIAVKFHPPRPLETFTATLTLRSNWPHPAVIALRGQGMAEPGRYVFGSVRGTWDWQAGVSPDYIVLDSVQVPAHESLRIRPGARILFEPGAVMKVEGELRAVGLPTDSILFLPRANTPETASRWRGLELSNSDATRLSFCQIFHTLDGVKVRESSPTIQFSSIRDNGIPDLTVDTTNSGGVFMENSGARLIGCEITDNYARKGGGIYILNSKPRITNCRIFGNHSWYGGGLYLKYQADAWIQSNLIYENVADSACGGIYVVEESNPQIINNTIVNNSGGGIISAVRSIPTLKNSVVYSNNGPSISYGPEANILVSYCDIDGGFRGASNLDVEPGFVDASAGNFELQEEPRSPLIDAGNPEPSNRDYFFPPSKGSVVNDIGAFGGPLSGGWESPEISVLVFQNPAFTRWLDVFVGFIEDPVTAPVCSLGIESREPSYLALSPLDSASGWYRGSWRASGSAVIFLTVEATLTGDRLQKVGRTFNLKIVEPGGAGRLSLVGVDGHVDLRAGSSSRELCLVADCDLSANAPDDLSPLTPVFRLQGFEGALARPAEIEIKLPVEGLEAVDLSRMAVYRLHEGRFTRLPGGWRDGWIRGETILDGHFIVALGEVDTDGGGAPTPVDYTILRAYPNPFNQSTQLVFNLREAGTVSLSVFDLTGRRVAYLVNDEFAAGQHRLAWAGLSDEGVYLPSGIYWTRLETAEHAVVVKLLLVR